MANDAPKQDHKRSLGHLEEISKNARTTWFGLLGVLVFAAIAVSTVRDRDFFSHGVETDLPLVGVSVPTVPFFWAAPVLVLAIYCYLHLYLLKLWHAISVLPSEVTVDGETAKLIDAAYPWLLSDAAIYLKKPADRRFLLWLTLLISILLVWFAGPFVLGLFWVRSWAYHDEMLTAAISIQMMVAIWLGASTFWHMTHKLMAPQYLNTVFGVYIIEVLSWAFFVASIFVTAAVIIVYGWNRTQGPFFGLTLVSLWPANLETAELVGEREEWLPHREALAQFLAGYYGKPRSQLNAADLSDGIALKSFYDQRYDSVTALKRLPLVGADLRLAQADLLFAPRMEFVFADLREARLQLAALEFANFRGAKLDQVDFDGAALQFANFQCASLVGASFDSSSLEGAQFAAKRKACLHERSAIRSRIEAEAIGHQTREAPLRVGPDLDGALFMRVDFSDANLTGASMVNTVIFSADLRDVVGLTQEQLDTMIGNSKTLLPPGLMVPSCFKPEMIDDEVIKKAVWIYNNIETVADFRKRYECDESNRLAWFSRGPVDWPKLSSE